MNIEFPDKTVIVTGGAHGFGRAIAHAFAARGAHTWTCDILAEGLKETAAKASPAAGGRIATALVDVTDRAAVGRFVDRVAQATGRIDILVNNAGGVCGQVGQPIEDVGDVAMRVIPRAGACFTVRSGTATRATTSSCVACARRFADRGAR